MAVLVPDERCLVLYWKNLRIKKQNRTTFHPGPVLPPGGEGSPLLENYELQFNEKPEVIVRRENFIGVKSQRAVIRNKIASFSLSLKGVDFSFCAN